MIQKIPLLIFAAFLLLSCKSSKKTAQGPLQLKSDIENLSPGHLLAQFKVLNEEATESDSNPIYGIEILTVEKYGAATPALAKGEVVRVVLSTSSLKTNLSVGSTYIGLFSHSEKVINTKQIPDWELISIK